MWAAGVLAFALAVEASEPLRPICRDSNVLLQTHASSAAEQRLRPTLALREGAAWDAAFKAARERGGNKSFRQAMINFGEAQYVSYLTVGRQVIAGILDSGSFELVVFGADCKSCGAAAHYNSHLSNTYRQGMLMTQQNYGSGEVSSVAGTEQVAIGPFPHVDQAFWNVQQAKMDVLFDAAFEAVVGLGPPETPMVDAWDVASSAVAAVTAYYEAGTEAPDNVTANAQARITVANEITQRAPLLHSLNCTSFSVCIGTKPDSDGAFVWNDTIAFERPELFTKVPVAGNHTWAANLTEPFLDYPLNLGAPDGKASSARLGCEEGCSALLDSGTSLLAVPRNVIESIHLAMTRLKPDCSNLHVLPDLTFKLGGSLFRLPADAYMAKVVGDWPRTMQPSRPREQNAEPERACQMMLMETASSPGSGPLWILGLPFFRRYYTTFNLGRNKAERAIFTALHSEDDSCTPVAQGSFKRGPLELRHVTAERLRLPQASMLAERIWL